MKSAKRFIVTVICLFAALYIWGILYSRETPLVSLPAIADTNRIRNDLYFLTKQCRYRNFMHPDHLDKAAGYIRTEFEKLTNSVWYQEFSIDSSYNFQHTGYKNVVCSFGPPDAERIIIGAHYDACMDKEGADDNASGVCGLLELARLLQKEKLRCRIDLVAYTNEEPPFFGSNDMGSYVHAKSLHDSSVQVKGMICLEMIGYYNDAPGSQDYPVFFLNWFYGNKGNFITVTKKSFGGAFAKFISKRMKKSQVIPTKSFTGPSWIGGIDLSDHRNYWKFGYSAVMITNTAFFRNKNYHTEEDVAEKLDVKKMGLVVDELYRTIIDIP